MGQKGQSTGWKMECMGQTDKGMNRHREGQKRGRDRQAWTDGWAYKGAKKTAWRDKRTDKKDMDEQMGHKDGQIHEAHRQINCHMNRQIHRQDPRIDNIQLGQTTQRGKKNSWMDSKTDK